MIGRKCVRWGMVGAVLAAFFVVLAGTWAGETPSWEALQKTYDYPRDLKLDAKESVKTETEGYKLLSITFTSVNGESVPALMALPKTGKGPYPCVILQHGYGGDKESMILLFGGAAAENGTAVIGIDAQYHGARKVEGKDIFSTDLDSNRKAIIQTVIDLRRVVDYLETRSDIDKSRIGYVGVSMGGILGGIFGGVEPRVKAVALLVGGGNWRELIASSTIGPAGPLRELLAEANLDIEARFADIEPLNFVEHISPRPLLMLNGKKDNIVPPKCSQQLYDRAKEPKKIVWFDTGHSLMDMAALTTLTEWLDENVIGKPGADKGEVPPPAKD